MIMTGTPNASGHLDPGDEAIVHVEGIGDLLQRGGARLIFWLAGGLWIRRVCNVS